MRRALGSLLLVLLAAAPLAAQVTIGDLNVREQPIDLSLDYTAPVLIENINIACTAPGQAAIRIQFPDSPSVAVLTVTIRNVTILPGCARGIWLTNGWNARIDQVSIWGDYAAPMDVGILLDGRSNDTVITAAHSWYTTTAILVAGQVESPHIADSALINTVNGIVVDTEQVIPERPGLFVRDTHIAATSRGIVTRWHPQGSFSGNLIYRTGNDPAFVGIEVATRSADTLLAHNVVMCGGAGKAVTLNTQAPRSSQTQTDPILCTSGVSYNARPAPPVDWMAAR